MDRLAHQEQRLRWLLKDAEILEKRAQILYGKMRTLRVGLRFKGAHEHVLLTEATRAHRDSRLVAAWAHELEREAQAASRGGARSGSQYGRATSFPGLAAALRDRAKKLTSLIDEVASELERQYRELSMRLDDPRRHSAGASGGADGLVELVSHVTDFLGMIEKFLQHALQQN